jgi:hypothetical protein
MCGDDETVMKIGLFGTAIRWTFRVELVQPNNLRKLALYWKT